MTLIVNIMNKLIVKLTLVISHNTRVTPNT